MSEYGQEQQQSEATIFSLLSQFSHLKIKIKKIAAQGGYFLNGLAYKLIFAQTPTSDN